MEGTISAPELLSEANKRYIERKRLRLTMTANGTMVVANDRFSLSVSFDLSPQGVWRGYVSTMIFVEKDELSKTVEEAATVGKALLAGVSEVSVA